MDGFPNPISPIDLYNAIGTATAPLVIDARTPEDFDAAAEQIVGSIRRLPAQTGSGA